MKHNKNVALRNVVIARNAYKWQYGGAEQFAYNLARALEVEGINTTVVSRVPELLTHCKRENIGTFRNLWFKNETHRRWMPFYYVLSPVLIGQYAWLLLRTRADLLIVTSRDDQIFGTMAAKLVGVPVIWFDHADMKHIVAHPFRFLSRSYYWALRNADRVIMTSQAEWNKISENLATSKQSNFVLINNGATIRPGTAMPRPTDAKIVAYVGRLDRDKGIFDLVDAAAEVIKTVPRAEFWIAGKGQDEEEFREKISKLGVSDHFNLIGHMENVQDLLLAADVFVYPTHHDAAPLAPVEAMLAGVPVVASRIGGIPEAVPATAGLLVPAMDATKLADAITGLLTNDTKRKELSKGALVAGRKLEFGTVLKDKYLPLFRGVAGRSL